MVCVLHLDDGVDPIEVAGLDEEGEGGWGKVQGCLSDHGDDLVVAALAHRPPVDVDYLIPFL